MKDDRQDIDNLILTVRKGLKKSQDVQWDKSSPGNSASHYSDQIIIKLNFLVA